MRTTVTVDITLETPDAVAAEHAVTALLRSLTERKEVAEATIVPHDTLDLAAWRRSRQDSFASPRQTPFGRVQS